MFGFLKENEKKLPIWEFRDLLWNDEMSKALSHEKRANPNQYK
jgi:hypothetical protein